MRQLLTRIEDFRECLQNASIELQLFQHHGLWMIMYEYASIFNIYQYVSSHITHTGEDWQVGVHLKHQGGIAKRAGWRKANQRSLRLSPMLNGHVRMITTFKSWPLYACEHILHATLWICLCGHVLWFVHDGFQAHALERTEAVGYRRSQNHKMPMLLWTNSGMKHNLTFCFRFVVQDCWHVR